MRFGGLSIVLVSALASNASAQVRPAQHQATNKGAVSVRDVRYAPAPEWVIAPPAASDAPLPPGAPLRVVYSDSQVRVNSGVQEEYQSWKLKILSPEGLGAGNIAVAWSPANEEMIVHRLTIIRDGKSTDVLAGQKFAVIQRENDLEQSMLHGDLTATLQAAGLQIGDELEFAATKRRRGLAPAERADGFMQFPLVGIRGAYRLRVLSPKAAALTFRSAGDLPSPTSREIGTEVEHQYLLVDPASVSLPDQAPVRYMVKRLVQFGDYPDWATLSRSFAAPFAQAADLAADSPVRAEANRIAAQTSDPARRVEAALRVVQDRIRYVYVGLDGGNYRPAGADETWSRKFGDCKGKSALLIALLREMGITAEAVLVASKGGDGMDQRLPSPALFDHVVVRATVNGAPVWLDGTRLGDRSLATLDPPLSRWVLPLRADGGALEPLAFPAPRLPNRVEVVDIDASAGFDKPARYRIQQTLRGDEIYAIRAQLAGVATSDADKMLAAYWRQQYPAVEASNTSWRFDEDNRLLVLGLTGEGKMDWEGDAKDGHTHYLFGGGFPPPSELNRPKDQPQDAPYANDYPAFSCYATTVKVPPAGKGFRWSFSSKPMDRTLGGISYWRISSFDGQVARMVKSRRVDAPEISAAEAAALNAAIAGFDNNKSYVWEVTGKASTIAADATSRFGSFEDFASATPPCQSQVRTTATTTAGAGAN
ncbi:DUF3857 domain-containing transglutaminase family protein [Sphingomonas sp. IC4-52]|uniref:DUF3857 domain-containing transglutaminase family protein n=1 Tax=Sphingomonas sp. IC4-52 TaxID=2887202 RepID=UPI001D0F8461|nr:DUF3857 domain-containing transglutaminase family protein [Sphingomonas sp. IC4-52]MCC2980674.1 DUF3857 domain-containing transglutaminase family protein [Sphingomonas sp. IC4-52]